jgi:hypothetical protein
MQSDWNMIQVNDWFIVECYIRVDPETYKDVWNNYWLKQYAVALCKMQYGFNLLKTTNNILPGGVQINAEFIYNEGKADKEALEQRLRDEFELPVDMFMG